MQDCQVVFTMWLGSYFGDWNNESNFLRAPLGSSHFALTSSYSGFPQWLYHPMALGQTAGFCARLTQNNKPGGLYPPFNPGTNQVHIALLGDPTLRLTVHAGELRFTAGSVSGPAADIVAKAVHESPAGQVTVTRVVKDLAVGSKFDLTAGPLVCLPGGEQLELFMAGPPGAPGAVGPGQQV